MQSRFTVAALAVLLAVSCATGAGRPEDIPKPGIGIQQLHPIFFGSTGSAPVSFDVVIQNRSRVPLEVIEIEIGSLGGAQFELLRNVRRMRVRIAPGATEAVNMYTMAVSRSGRGTPTEPASVRAIVVFETPDGERFREIVLDPSVLQ